MNVKRIAFVLIPLCLAATACTTLSQDDRALLEAAAKNSQEAKAQAQRANETSQQALAAARQADASAREATTAAHSSNEQQQRMFQKTIRK